MKKNSEDPKFRVVCRAMQCFLFHFFQIGKNSAPVAVLEQNYIIIYFQTLHPIKCMTQCVISSAWPLGKNLNTLFIENMSKNCIFTVQNDTKTGWYLTKSMRKLIMKEVDRSKNV